MNREASSLPQDLGQVFAGNSFQSHPTTREAGKCSLLQKGHIDWESVSCSDIFGSLQLHRPTPHSPLGSSIHGILQARILE